MGDSELAQELEQAEDQLADYVPKKEEPTLGIDNAVIEQVAFRLWDKIKLNERQEKIGEHTGFRFLEDTIFGFIKTHLWVVGGYTSHGKTALMIQLIINALKHNPNISIAVFSTEMSAEMILLRLIANRIATPSLTLLRGRFEPNTEEVLGGAFKYFHKKKIWLYDDVYTFKGIEQRCKAIKSTSPLDVVFVDFLQNMEADGSLYDRMSTIPIQLQKMAKSLDTCVVAMSQVSNEAAQGGSRVIGYKGGGEIAAACDLGLWLERDPDDKELLTCLIRKNKEGPTGKKRLRFTDNFTRIVEAE